MQQVKGMPDSHKAPPTPTPSRGNHRRRFQSSATVEMMLPASRSNATAHFRVFPHGRWTTDCNCDGPLVIDLLDGSVTLVSRSGRWPVGQWTYAQTHVSETVPDDWVERLGLIDGTKHTLECVVRPIDVGGRASERVDPKEAIPSSTDNTARPARGRRKLTNGAGLVLDDSQEGLAGGATEVAQQQVAPTRHEVEERKQASPKHPAREGPRRAGGVRLDQAQISPPAQDKDEMLREDSDAINTSREQRGRPAQPVAIGIADAAAPIRNPSVSTAEAGGETKDTHLSSNVRSRRVRIRAVVASEWEGRRARATLVASVDLKDIQACKGIQFAAADEADIFAELAREVVAHHSRVFLCELHGARSSLRCARSSARGQFQFVHLGTKPSEFCGSGDAVPALSTAPK